MCVQPLFYCFVSQRLTLSALLFSKNVLYGSAVSVCRMLRALYLLSNICNMNISRFISAVDYA